MASNGWLTAGAHPGGQKKLYIDGVTVQLKLMSAGQYSGQQRLYGETPAGGWYAVVLDREGVLLGHGAGATKGAARQAMLDSAGLQA